MKDLIEPFLYPHNLFLWGLLFAAVRYRKKGLWLLLLWFYAFGNGYVGNQVRHWYYNNISATEVAADFQGNYVVLGCGGTENTLPDCAKSRLDQLAEVLSDRPVAATVHITTLYCQPYLDYLQKQLKHNVELDCFHGGATTYHEFYQLNNRLDKSKALLFVSSDYHAFRVKRLAQQYHFQATVLSAQSSTFKPVNCGTSCYLTVNLSNFDLFAKLTAEMSSYYVYAITKGWVSWYKETAAQPTGSEPKTGAV